MGEALNNEAIYVVVGQIVRESKKTLLWTLKKRSFKKIFLLNVHIPISSFPYSSSLGESNINAFQDSEWKTTNNSLEEYRDICTNNGVAKDDVDTLVTEGDEIGVIDKAIVKLIRENNIKNLVMAAAPDSHYSEGMSITSRKAEYVNEHAPPDCKIWFICDGKLIKTREASSKGNKNDVRVRPPIRKRKPNPPPSPRKPPKKKAFNLFATGCGILLAIVILLYETWWFVHFFEEFFTTVYAQLGINQSGFGFSTFIAFIFLVAGLGAYYIKPMFNDTTKRGNNKKMMKS